MNGTLFIVDALNFLFRAFHALPPLKTKAGLPTGALYGFCQMLLRIDREHRPTHTCVVFDAPGATFRETLYPAYKAQRPATPPELIEQIIRSHAMVEAFGYPLFCVPGVEADDVIATLVKTARAADMEVIIGSSDKDLMQCVDEQVRLLDPMRNRLMGPSEVKERFGVFPNKLGDLLALTGDTVDNVPGVPGIGPKTAADLLATWGSLEGILSHVGEIKGKKGQVIAGVREALALSRQLVTLKEDVPLPRDLASLRRASPDYSRIVPILRELEFGRLLDQMQTAEAAALGLPLTPLALPEKGGVDLVDKAPSSPVVRVISLDRVEQIKQALEPATEVGISYLLDATASLWGIAFAPSEGSAFYLPCARGMLTDAMDATEVTALLRWVFLDRSFAVHVHDVKPLQKALLELGLTIPNLGIDSLLAALVLPRQGEDTDLATLAQEQGLPPPEDRSQWLGTGRLAKPVDELSPEAAASFLANEARVSLALAQKLAPLLTDGPSAYLYREMEKPLASLLARMEKWGIGIDCDRLRSLSQEVAILSQALEGEIYALAGGEFNPGSPKQLADVLFVKLGLPILRKTKTGASTDAEVLEELASQHPLPEKLLEWRSLTKLRGTYLDALPALVHPRTHRIHTTYRQDVAATGRLSSSDPNLQNIPIRSALGMKIRQAFVADPGFSIVSADYSQIELRVLAHLCEDPAFLDAFHRDADIHRRTAAEVFGITEAEVSTEQRRIAKAINFGLVFGQTDFGLGRVLRIPRAEAKRYIESYFARYAKVRGYMDDTIARARQDSSVQTILGRQRPLPDIHSPRAQARAYAERIARNTPIQGSAAEILKLAMLAVDRGLGKFPRVRLLLTVHDELVFEVPTEEVPEFSPWVKNVMESAFTLKVPLRVEVGHGPTWGDAH